MTDICFVHMPFSQLGHPSMAFSVLQAECQRAGITSKIFYGNLRFAAALGLGKYLQFMHYLPYFILSGEMVFKPYAGYPDAATIEDYYNFLSTKMLQDETHAELLRQSCAAYKLVAPHVEDFLEQLSEAVLAEQPHIVGCDITYEQRNAALALLKKIKEKAPQVITMLGGNSCTAEHGKALVDYAPYVDGVFSGEADTALPLVYNLLKQGRSLQECNAACPSFLIKGAPIVNGAEQGLEQSPVPDFNDYFAELQATGLDRAVQPCLLIEGSRGCWWGEKSRCNFCGIHTCCEALRYRQKSPQKIVAELALQSQKYGVYSFVFTDCILSNSHVQQLPALLRQLPHKLRLFAEVKSNLTAEQLQQLKTAGFIVLQPGIEALQDDLLRLMNKGNRAIKHIELLKLCRSHGINIIWNLLGKMPYEKAAYYEETTALLPLLTHLQPPVHLNNILFQKNSNYTRNAADYGLQLQPLPVYAYTGDFGGDFVAKIAEYFLNAAPEDFSTPLHHAYTQTAEAVINWLRSFKQGAGDKLTCYDKGDALEILDLRGCAKQLSYTLTGSLRDIYLAAETTLSLQQLQQRLPQLAEAELQQALDYLVEQQLVVRIKDEVLALALPPKLDPYVYDSRLPIGRINLAALEEK